MWVPGYIKNDVVCTFQVSVFTSSSPPPKPILPLLSFSVEIHHHHRKTPLISFPGICHSANSGLVGVYLSQNSFLIILFLPIFCFCFWTLANSIHPVKFYLLPICPPSLFSDFIYVSAFWCNFFHFISSPPFFAYKITADLPTWCLNSTQKRQKERQLGRWIQRVSGKIHRVLNNVGSESGWFHPNLFCFGRIVGLKQRGVKNADVRSSTEATTGE